MQTNQSMQKHTNSSKTFPLEMESNHSQASLLFIIFSHGQNAMDWEGMVVLGHWHVIQFALNSCLLPLPSHSPGNVFNEWGRGNRPGKNPPPKLASDILEYFWHIGNYRKANFKGLCCLSIEAPRQVWKRVETQIYWKTSIVYFKLGRNSQCT